MIFAPKKNIKYYKIVLFVIVLLTSGCIHDIDWLDGKWEGVGCQLDLEENATWSINLEIDVDKELFNIEYPSLECSGKWELRDYSSDRAIFDELIEDNTNECIEKGTVILTKVDDHHISFSYYIFNDKDVLAFSTLRRKKN